MSSLQLWSCVRTWCMTFVRRPVAYPPSRAARCIRWLPPTTTDISTSSCVHWYFCLTVQSSMFVCWRWKYIVVKLTDYRKHSERYKIILFYLSVVLYIYTISQAVSRWLPTAEDEVRARIRSCGIFGGQSDTGGGFLRVLRFRLPIFIPPIAPQSPSSVIWGWYKRPVVAAVPSELGLTPLRIIHKRKENS
jgi:hypothetical protein